MLQQYQYSLWYDLTQKTPTAKARIEPGSPVLETGASTTKPARRFAKKNILSLSVKQCAPVPYQCTFCFTCQFEKNCICARAQASEAEQLTLGSSAFPTTAPTANSTANEPFHTQPFITGTISPTLYDTVNHSPHSKLHYKPTFSLNTSARHPPSHCLSLHESACVTPVYRPFVHVRYVCVRERVD